MYEQGVVFLGKRGVDRQVVWAIWAPLGYRKDVERGGHCNNGSQERDHKGCLGPVEKGRQNKSLCEEAWKRGKPEV